MPHGRTRVTNQGSSVWSSSSKASESGSPGGSSSTQDALSKLSHIRKALFSAWMVLSKSPQSGSVKSASCLHPQKTRMPRYRSSVGITSSRSDVQQRKASLPTRCSFGGSHMSAKATQCAKVDFQMAVISVHMRLPPLVACSFHRPSCQCCESRTEGRGSGAPRTGSGRLGHLPRWQCPRRREPPPLHSAAASSSLVSKGQGAAAGLGRTLGPAVFSKHHKSKFAL